MKTKNIFIILICTLFLGCTIPCDVFFRNLSNETVLLKGKLVDRWYFDKLPNKVDFYDTAQKLRQICGGWKYQKLITWTDSTNFHIDIPPYSIIDLGDVSRGLTLGARSPDVLLIVSSSIKADTLTTGDYPSLAAKFQVKRAFFSNPVYYFDKKQ
jgi:hypothetical protein